VLLLAACGTSGITRVGGGPAIEAPRPQPATDAEVREWCEFDLEKLKPDVQRRVIADCRSNWNGYLNERRRNCRDEVNEWAKSLPRANTQADRRSQQQLRETRIDQCVRQGHDFQRTMLAARQFQEFQRIVEPAGYGSFIARHGGSDLIGLVAEAQARYAPLCGAGVAANASADAARAWMAQFERVGPLHCKPQQDMARRALRREELAQAAGSVEKLDAFVARHANDDPEGLVPGARAVALDLVRERERAALESARSWGELETFADRFQPSKDARYALAAEAARRIALARAQEIARIQTESPETLDRRLESEAANWPAEWQQLVRERLITTAEASADIPSGLRLWRLSSRAEVFARAVAAMQPGANHDEAVEATWKRSGGSAALRDAVLAYGRKRDSFRGWMLAYGISNATDDLRQAGARAATRADKAGVEYELIKRIGTGRFFTTSGRLTAGGKAVDINHMNIGIGHSILSQTESLLEWQARPDSGLMPLEHGTYRLDVKLSLVLDQVTTAKILGISSSTKDQSTLEARQSVVIGPSSRYVAQGSHRFKWTPTLQVGAVLGFGAKVETTGMSVKVEVVGVQPVEQ
jgi:hypothetical protein